MIRQILMFLVLSCSMFAQQKKAFELGTVDKLRSMPASHFDSALPDQQFGKWFKRLVYPSVPDFQLRECEGQAASPAKTQCIYVSAPIPQQVRVINLRFAVDDAGKDFHYVEGTVGPSDPRNKQPTRNITKLSELVPLVKPEGQ